MLKIKKFSKKELPLKLSMFRDASGGEKKKSIFCCCLFEIYCIWWGHGFHIFLIKKTLFLTIKWKGVYQGCILLPCLFNLYAENIMRNAGLDETQTGIKIASKISITSDMQMTPYGRKWRKTKEPLDESEKGEWKSWLKTQHSEN